MDLRISIFQFDIKWLNPQDNISLIRKRLDSINKEFDLLILPEMYLTGFCMDPSLSAISEDSIEINELIEIARQFNIGIMGSLAIQEHDHFYNRVNLLTKNGIEGRYDKQYLYSPSGESEVFDSKYDTELFTYKGYKILPQVCYDLRFPENVRPIQAPDILIYMANWPKPRIHHWDALLRARAIENQCYTIGCNRLGNDGNEWEYPGHSVVIKPDGIALEMDLNSKDTVVELSKKEVERYRSKYRFLEDKKV